MEERDEQVRRGSWLRSAIRAGLAPVGPRPPTPSSTGPDGPAALAGPATPGTKGELYRGFGDSYTRAFELAVTPTIFGAMGYGLDNWLGIVPVLTLVFALAAVIGLMARTWYGYTARMQALEQAGPWAQVPGWDTPRQGVS